MQVPFLSEPQFPHISHEDMEFGDGSVLVQITSGSQPASTGRENAKERS